MIGMRFLKRMLRAAEAAQAAKGKAKGYEIEEGKKEVSLIQLARDCGHWLLVSIFEHLKSSGERVPELGRRNWATSKMASCAESNVT
jgi:hypothetical protein